MISDSACHRGALALFACRPAGLSLADAEALFTVNQPFGSIQPDRRGLELAKSLRHDSFWNSPQADQSTRHSHPNCCACAAPVPQIPYFPGFRAISRRFLICRLQVRVLSGVLQGVV